MARTRRDVGGEGRRGECACRPVDASRLLQEPAFEGDAAANLHAWVREVVDFGSLNPWSRVQPTQTTGQTEHGCC